MVGTDKLDGTEGGMILRVDVGCDVVADGVELDSAVIGDYYGSANDAFRRLLVG